MQRAFLSVAAVTVLSALLGIACLFLAQKGYPFGALGLSRLNSVANAATFIPLTAVYFVSTALLMLLPLRAASFVLSHVTEVLLWTAVTLFAVIAGVTLARFAWGQTNALIVLFDLRFLYAVALIGTHFALDKLRGNVLTRTLAFVVFLAAAAFCLFYRI